VAEVDASTSGREEGTALAVEHSTFVGVVTELALEASSGATSVAPVPVAALVALVALAVAEPGTSQPKSAEHSGFVLVSGLLLPWLVHLCPVPKSVELMAGFQIW